MTRARSPRAPASSASRSPAACIAGCSLGGGDDKKAGSVATPRPRACEVVEGQGTGKGAPTPGGLFKNEGQGVVTVISLFGTGGLESILGGDGGGGGLGSGFVLNGDGEVATNAHVVTQGEGEDTERAREVYVEFADGNRVPAKILGAGPQRRRRAAQDRPEGPDAAPAAARLQRRRQGRLARRGDRLAVRRAPVAVGRRRLGDRPRHPLAQRRVRDPGRDPDRRGDQPRQLRRAAGRRRRQGDRHQPADQVAVRRRRGRRLRGAGRRRQALARRAARVRQAPTTPTSGSAPSRCTRSSWTRFDLTVAKGAWVQDGLARQPGRARRASAAARARSASRSRPTPQGGDIITKVEGTADHRRQRPLLGGGAVPAGPGGHGRRSAATTRRRRSRSSSASVR